MKSLLIQLRNILAGIALILPATGYSLELSQRPLSVGDAVEPNVMFVIDDSGSMAWEYMPDAIGSYSGASRDGWWGDYSGTDVYYKWYYSSSVNTVYYNPELTYRPPARHDGTRYPQASFNNAYLNGYSQSGTRINLNNRFDARSYSFDEAFYYLLSDTEACRENLRNNSCYTYVGMASASEADKNNFANWYSYYRTRMYAARAGIGEAFSGLNETFRLGWGQINSRARNIDDANSITAVRQGVRPYDNDSAPGGKSHKERFYDFLYSAPANGNTPLRPALEGAGQYYEKSGQAWADDPSSLVSASNPERECRLSYTILMTDGFWNSSAPSGSVGNADNQDGDPISNGTETYQYTPRAPFSDRSSQTLADVAMYYWNRDLRPDLDNFVPRQVVRSVPTLEGETPYVSPAFWQHMVTYGVGLGVSSSSGIEPEDAFRAIRTGENISWPSPVSGRDSTLDDLLHAAVNGHGGFFSASDPETFADRLSQVLAEITRTAGSATSPEVAGETVQEGELLFAAAYDPNNWSGDLKAVRLGSGAALIPDIDAAIAAGNGWSAAEKLDNPSLSPDDRVIISYNGDSNRGVPFRWASGSNGLSAAAIADLSGSSAGLAEARLDFLRGDRSREDSDFRERGSRLGSIVHSSPKFVGAPSSGWPDSGPFGASGKSYSSFLAAASDRTPVVYVGANDGMLHGFQATPDGGNELLAYIPGFLYSSAANEGLAHLTSPGYSHRFYADLATEKYDVFTYGRQDSSGNRTGTRDWRTVLVGGARAGGKGIFALDVTDPERFEESKAAGLALWEFTAADDSRLGYITQPPVVAMSSWGGQERWTVFLANGYNSETNSTGFFVLDFEGGLDGNWSGNYQYVEFETGSGLSPLAVLDTTGNYMADRIYAGDLDGNIWVAEVNSDGNWVPAYDEPLITVDEPVTGAPAVGANRERPRAGNLPNLMVYFGTGQYLESGDVTDTGTQAFYGVWDNGTKGLDTSDLLERELEVETRTVEGASAQIRFVDSDARAIDFNTEHGWYAELPDTGERVITTPEIRGNYVYISTLVPSSDPCAGGGSGWIMAFERMGGRTYENVGAFEGMPDDTQGYRVDGIPSQVKIIGDHLLYGISGDDPEFIGLPPLSGMVPGTGRRGWHELVE